MYKIVRQKVMLGVVISVISILVDPFVCPGHTQLVIPDDVSISPPPSPPALSPSPIQSNPAGTSPDSTLQTLPTTSMKTCVVEGFEFIRIPAGEFTMGSMAGEAGHTNDESPRHREIISRSFWMGKYEVTQSQWQAVMGTKPSARNLGGDYPVENVSWLDCQKFVSILNSRGKGKFRLPSEAEWEYACRAGSETAWCFGNDQNMADTFAWHKGNSEGESHPVGQKNPNAWGLYDMHGNVYEWCQDNYAENYQSRPGNGKPWQQGGDAAFVRRGGSWAWPADKCRSAFRGSALAENKRNDAGLRLVMVEQSPATTDNRATVKTSTGLFAELSCDHSQVQQIELLGSFAQGVSVTLIPKSIAALGGARAQRSTKK